MSFVMLMLGLDLDRGHVLDSASIGALMFRSMNLWYCWDKMERDNFSNYATLALGTCFRPTNMEWLSLMYTLQVIDLGRVYSKFGGAADLMQ